MKTSDNIVATAGVMALPNYNVFEGIPLTKEGFKHIAKQIATLLEAGMQIQGNCQTLSLALLSTPIIQDIGNNQYMMRSGFFVWNGRRIKPDSIISIVDDYIDISQYDFVSIATMSVNEMVYDTYNATNLEEISDDILKELDVRIDKKNLHSVLDEEVDLDDDPMEHFNQIKYLSVYAPDIERVSPDIPCFGVTREVTQTLQPDTSAWAEAANIFYDRFLIEFVNRTQPFAFVAVEAMGTLVTKEFYTPEPGKEDFTPEVDFFKKQFDDSSLKLMSSKFTPQVVMETYQKIANL